MTTFKSLFRPALALSLAMMPSVAEAGTTTAVSNVAVELVAQCTVAGATVNLGTFVGSQTWATVANSLGYYLVGTNGSLSDSGIRMGTRGWTYANFGSVTCDAAAPYTLTIAGTHTQQGMARITIGGTTALFMPAIKSVGGAAVADNPGGTYAGSGHQMGFSAMPGTGTGSAQELLGSMVMNLNTAAGTNVNANSPIGNAGTYSDVLTYTLNF